MQGIGSLSYPSGQKWPNGHRYFPFNALIFPSALSGQVYPAAHGKQSVRPPALEAGL